MISNNIVNVNLEEAGVVNYDHFLFTFSIFLIFYHHRKEGC